MRAVFVPFIVLLAASIWIKAWATELVVDAASKPPLAPSPPPVVMPRMTVESALESLLLEPSPPRSDPPRLSVSRERPLAEQPFWKSKPEQRRKLYEERAVLVSVRDEREQAVGSERIRFTIKGAGVVAAPKAFAFAIARQYSKLKSVSAHFKTVEFHSASQKLFLVMEALGYEARMVLKMTPVSEDWRDELQWEVVWGEFKGMTGVIAFERTAQTGRTEVSVEAVYLSEKLPLPKVLMTLALEAIAQRVAEKMRVFIEREYAESGRGV